MNLTNQQKDLLRLLVSQHALRGGSQFILVRHHTASALIYAGGISIPVAHDDADFHQLQRESLITLTRNPGGQLCGKPTELGLTLVRRSVSFFRPETRQRRPPEQAVSSVKLYLPPEPPRHELPQTSVEWVREQIDKANSSLSDHIKGLPVDFEQGEKTREQVEAILCQEFRYWAHSVFVSILREWAEIGVPPEDFEAIAREQVENVATEAEARSDLFVDVHLTRGQIFKEVHELLPGLVPGYRQTNRFRFAAVRPSTNNRANSSDPAQLTPTVGDARVIQLEPRNIEGAMPHRRLPRASAERVRAEIDKTDSILVDHTWPLPKEREEGKKTQEEFEAAFC